MLVPTWCPPSILTNFSWAKSHNFFHNAKIKIHRNIEHLIKLATSTENKRDMFSANVEYFYEFWFLLYEEIMSFSPWKIGKYTRWASCWDPYSWVAAIPERCHLCTEISKRRTIMQATVSRKLFDQHIFLQKCLFCVPKVWSIYGTPLRPSNCNNKCKSRHIIEWYGFIFLGKLKENLGDAGEKRKKKKSYYAKLKRQEDDKMAELAAKYRDRAKERRDGGPGSER